MSRTVSYGMAVFTSALLLFMVQPLISKYFLPWFGGAASLWATTMVVFQLLLFLGYLYVHLGVRWLSPGTHTSLHLLLIVTALVMLGLQWLSWGVPLLPTDGWAQGVLDQPILSVFGLLGITVGLPYFLLSTTSPLLQYWYGHVQPDRDPYRLYALSNAGSLIGLISYPVLVEPLFGIVQQSVIWAGLFLLTAACLMWAMDHFTRSLNTGEGLELETIKLPDPVTGLIWFSWAAFPSALFLAVTNRLSQIAPVVPFLWVLPLAIYLITLIVCFGWPDRYSRPLYTAIWFPAIACVVVTLFHPLETGLPSHLVILIFALFVGCMIGHGELTRRRPDDHGGLTAFYIVLSAGGAAGGIFVSLLAPWLFNGYWELHTLLFGGLIGVLVMLAKRPSSWLNRRSRWLTVPLILVVWLGIELALVSHAYLFVSGSSYLSRNFYGVTRVINQGLRNPNKIPKRIIKHGDTRHGSQYLTRQHRLEPTGYYVRSSGVGRAIRSLKNRQPSVNIGVVGLGAGVLASYGDTGDVVQFYEINPDIIKLSTGKKPMFSFLKQCPCETRIIKGDARLSMEDELRNDGSKNYDVLAIDVFQNDSPPAHLLTIEAFRLYLKHLDRNGIMAFHVSNRYLNLEKLIHQYVRMEGLHDRQVISMEQNTASRWIVVSRSEEALKGPAFEGALTVPIGDADVPIWTDQYSNLFTLVDWEIPGWNE